MTNEQMAEEIKRSCKDLERKIELFQKESQERMAQLELEIKQTINCYCGNLGKGHVAIGYPSTELGQAWGIWPPYMGSVKQASQS